MKKIIMIMIGFILLIGMVTFADEIIEIFDFDLLKDTAIKKSLSLESSRITLESNELELEDAIEHADTYNYKGGTRIEYINRMIPVISDPINANMNVELGKRSILKDKILIANSVYSKGMKYLLTLDEITLNEKVLEFEKQYLAFIEKRVKNGVATNTDLIKKTIDVQSQEIKVLEVKSSLNSIKIEINHILGSELNAEFKLNDKISLIEFKKFDVSKVYLERFDDYPSIYTKAEVLKIKEAIFELYGEYYLENNKEYKIALYDKKIAELELNDAKTSFEVALLSSYNNYLNAYDLYLLTIKQSELSSKLLTDANLKYKIGVINKEDLLKAEEAKIKADFAITNAIYSYNLRRIEFDTLY